MKVSSIELIVKTLNKAGVRYLVVGGVAVNAYGYGRITFDLDLVVELLPASVTKAFNALEAVGFKPVVPVTAAQFATKKLAKAIFATKA